jgi:glycosyltransferase involved in cell wall biosynthesis
MVSVLRRGKGHETLIQAARRLRDADWPAHFVIVGEGTSRPRVEEQIAELRLGEFVKLLGHRDDVPTVLRSLDLLVIPSLHENIPQVGLQALACQTPVVGSNVGGIPEIIRPGETGRLFPPGDAATLAQTIRAALHERDATRRFCEQGRRLVEQGHSLEVMLDRLDALYRRYLPSAS